MASAPEMVPNRMTSITFSTEKMPEASDYYRDWENEVANRICRKVAFVCQRNGWSEMWGVVLKPFADYEPGDIVTLDHDRINFAEDDSDLFTQPYSSLLELVSASKKTCE